MTDKKEKKKFRFEIAEIPTQTGIFVKDNEKDEVWEDKRALVEILNQLEEIKKAVV